MIDESAERIVTDVLRVLATAASEHLGPKETQRRLQLIERANEVELVWQRELYDDSLHYAAVIDLGEDSLSISYCADTGLPWPLRGVRRWSEQDLLRVGERTLTVHEAIGFLDFIWDEAPILNRLVRACVIEEALEQGTVAISQTELQVELDSFRRRRGLHQAADMHAWLRESGLTQARLERLLTIEAATRKLRHSISADRIRETFTERQRQLTRTVVATITYPDETGAEAAKRGLLAGEIEFYREFDRAAGEERAHIETFIGDSSDQPVELAQARETQLIGPLRRRRRFALMRVVKRAAAVLDDRTRTIIEDLLLDEWIAHERGQRPIDWSWGPTTTGSER